VSEALAEGVQTDLHRSARAVVGIDRFFGQFLLNACLPHGKSGGITRPCTGALVRSAQRAELLSLP